MSRVILFAFTLSLMTASLALGDIPVPPNMKYVIPRMVFDGVEKHADYVFYLRFETEGRAPNSRHNGLIEVEDEKPFDFNVQRIFGMSLLAMERKEFDKRAKEDPSLKWLTDKTDGVLTASVSTPSTTGSVNDKEVPITANKVTLKDGKLTVELQEADKARSDAAPDSRLPQANKARSDAAPDRRLSQVAFGIFIALSLAFLGVWFLRRRTPAA